MNHKKCERYKCVVVKYSCIYVGCNTVVFGVILEIACSVDNSYVSQYITYNVFVVDQWRGVSKDLITITVFWLCVKRTT